MLVLTGFSTLPLRIASAIGFFFTLFGGGVLIYVVVRTIQEGSIPGFPFLASIVSIFSGVQLFTLGIFGEYLARIFNRSMNHPAYVIGETTTKLATMKCVILQPSYIPWRGYFHQIWKADLFIFYDDVQYDKNGWRNRNRIKTSQGLQWLTIPVHTKGSVPESTPINKIKISWEKPWPLHHWRGIQFAYRNAPFFSQYEHYFSEIFSRKPEFLADFTIETTIEISRLLGIDSYTIHSLLRITEY